MGTNIDMIRFPHLGLEFAHVGKTVSVFGLEIAYYGIIVAAAMLSGVYMARWAARRTGQDPDEYVSFALIALVVSVFAARMYYVIFSWEYYRGHLMEIFDVRGGGLAIYGGVIGGVLTGCIYAKVRGIAPLLLLDTAVTGLVLGQAIGRWGNFFNREAFGSYTDSLLAMQLPLDAVRRSDVTEQMLSHLAVVDGTEFIQVHPVFLYESLWNLGLLAVLMVVTAKGLKAYNGEIFLLYLLGYGIGRAWMEMLRTDQLKLPGTNLAVSQVLSMVLAGTAAFLLIRNRCRKRIRNRLLSCLSGF